MMRLDFTKRRSTSRAGVAIFVVVMVCAVIGVFVAVVTFQSRDTRRKGAETRDRVQARFLAKGAHNHFLLKLKYLPAELYDAVSFSVGKNPGFDFSTTVQPQNLKVAENRFVPDADNALGPLFYTGEGRTQVSVSDGKLMFDRAAERDGLYSNAAAGFPAAPGNRAKMAAPLDQYVLDVATGYPVFNGNENGIVVVSATPHAERARMGQPYADTGTDPVANWADPFTGSYLVQSVKILGTGGATAATAGKRFQSDSVLLAVEANVLRGGQVSVTTRQGNALKPLLVAREIITAVRADGSNELDEQLESQSLYDSRVSGTTSARRTEVTTAIYLVTRKSR